MNATDSLASMIAALTYSDKRAVVLLVEKLDELDPSWRSTSEARSAILSLQKRLLDSGEQAREQAVNALTQIRDQSTVAYFLEALRKKDWKTQVLAAEALGEIQAHEAVNHLLLAFIEGQWPVPRAAAAALEKIDPQWFKSPVVQGEINELIGELQEKKWYIRLRAIWKLGKLKNPATLDVLLGSLDDPEEEVRAAAVRALDAFESLPLAEHRVILELARPNSEESRHTINLGENSIPVLFGALESDVAGMRRRAAKALGETGESSIVASLLADKLLDIDPEVRLAVAKALGQLGWQPRGNREAAAVMLAFEDWEGLVSVGHDAVPVIASQVLRGDPSYRQSAAVVLGKLGGEEAIAALVELLSDPSEVVSKIAVDSLDSIGWQPRSKREVVLLAIAWRAWEYILSIGEEAIPPMMDLLESASRDLQVQAARCLGYFKDVSAVNALVRIFVEGDYAVSSEAERALSHIGRPEVSFAVAPLLRGPDKSLAKRAADILGKIGDLIALRALVSALEEDVVCESAAAALEKASDPATSSLVLVAARSDKPQTRCLTSKILGARGSHEAQSILIDMLLHDSSSQVRRAAARALRAINWNPPDDNEKIYLALALDDLTAAVSLGSILIEPLLNEIDTNSFGAQVLAVRAIGKIGGLDAVNTLVRILSEGDGALRAVAAEALGDTGSARAVEPLFAALQDKSEIVSSLASAALDKVHAEWRQTPFVISRIPVLLEQLGSYSPEVRLRAVRGIGKIRYASGVRQLVSLLKDDVQDVRRASAIALGEIGGRAAIDALRGLAKESDVLLQMAAAQALHNLGEEADWFRSYGAERRISYEGASFHVIQRQRLSISTRESYSEGVGVGRKVPDVKLSAYFPETVLERVWCPLIAYIFREKAANAVETDARGQLGSLKAHMRQLTTEAQAALRRGAAITVTPSLKGVLFNPPKLTIALFEDFHRLDFRFRVEAARPNQSVNGSLVFRASGITIGVIPLSIFVSEAAERLGRTHRAGSFFRSVFASYSHVDEAVVEKVERVCHLLGIEYLRDERCLRSGDLWEERVLDLIKKADVFQLFWSDAAAASPHVRREWRQALALERDNFIWPVYWKKPLCRVPAALKKYHFSFEPGLALKRPDSG